MLLSVTDVLQVACNMHGKRSLVHSWQGTLQDELNPPILTAMHLLLLLCPLPTSLDLDLSPPPLSSLSGQYTICVPLKWSQALDLQLSGMPSHLFRNFPFRAVAHAYIYC